MNQHNKHVLRLFALIKRFNGRCHATLFINSAPLKEAAEWQETKMTSMQTRLYAVRPNCTAYAWEVIDVNSEEELKQGYVLGVNSES